ncbi:MAG: NUDIX hydrolase [Christensenellales bacterium]|jgi:8-oxo-dGTP pyrophosphatase MutT (NUDIX family)|nr:NUDIX hydrolase [Clostridiales bacterium]
MKICSAKERTQMIVKEIVGKNYAGKWDRVRIGCRGIVMKDSRILLSYETATDQWMIPGGGLKDGEDERTCCVREIAEETGVLVEPSQCRLEIHEYYGNDQYVNKYFICEVTGSTERRLTRREKEAGLEPRWLSVDEIKAIFAKHNTYIETDEMRMGMYLREYTALCELVN